MKRIGLLGGMSWESTAEAILALIAALGGTAVAGPETRPCPALG